MRAVGERLIKGGGGRKGKAEGEMIDVWWEETAGRKWRELKRKRQGGRKRGEWEMTDVRRSMPMEGKRGE